ncbi:hypothetical protein MHM98_08045 [Psychrobium sp. MM17-31]|uniref:hypothetical protein n=1 Tax=Psychrobium sp. MM17-31 TaxID=2917758 RepID=UPI001EF47CF3|nr:hypothetical protein [Psychrobium sp. MM17-31]MCG7531298.1 hypothetical protein [Psychrobium sp. MM17-31]
MRASYFSLRRQRKVTKRKANRRFIASLKQNSCFNETAFDLHPAAKAKKSSLIFSSNSYLVQGNK